MKKTYTFNCKVCGAEKSIPQSHKKRGGIYCSKACCAIGTRKSYTFNCKVCGAEKTVPRSFHANGCAVYCSKACCGIGKRKTYTFNCKVCGAEKSIPQREKNKGYGVYCSHACMGMSKRKDISGQIFNNLTVLKRDERDEQKGKSKWICLCTCGKEVSIRAVDLHSSHNKSCGSCGCVFKKHGTYKSAIYGSWGAMIQRCTNPKNSKYKYYGERGITVCDRWKSFENFLEDMGERPPGMTLDRIDNDKGIVKIIVAGQQEINRGIIDGI